MNFVLNKRIIIVMGTILVCTILYIGGTLYMRNNMVIVNKLNDKKIMLYNNHFIKTIYIVDNPATKIASSNLRKYRYGFKSLEYNKTTRINKGLPFVVGYEIKLNNHINGSEYNNWSHDSRYSIIESVVFQKSPNFIINHPNRCTNKTIDGLVVFFTATTFKERRAVIRQHCTTNNPKYQYIFLMGLPVKDSDIFMNCNDKICKIDWSTLDNIKDENEKYQDIILSNNLDIYQLLTLKTMTAMQWATHYCRHAKILLKIDDDICVNWVTINDIVQNKLISNNAYKQFLWYGYRMTYEVLRKTAGVKNFVDYDKYPGVYYPFYGSGSIYFMSMRTANVFSKMATRIPVLPVEDVWCGIAGALLGLTLLDMPTLYDNTNYYSKLYASSDLAKEKNKTAHEIHLDYYSKPVSTSS